MSVVFRLVMALACVTCAMANFTPVDWRSPSAPWLQWFFATMWIVNASVALFHKRR